VELMRQSEGRPTCQDKTAAPRLTAEATGPLLSHLWTKAMTNDAY
jgi:hypothetical protein